MSFGLMSKVYSRPSSLLVHAVLISHEYGHYYSALTRDGKPDHPFLVPVGIGAVGATRIRNIRELSRESKRKIISAGPIAGVIAAVALFPFAMIFLSKTSVLVLTGITAIEIYNGIFGSDGKKLRNEKE